MTKQDERSLNWRMRRRKKKRIVRRHLDVVALDCVPNFTDMDEGESVSTILRAMGARVFEALPISNANLHRTLKRKASRKKGSEREGERQGETETASSTARATFERLPRFLDPACN
ncbi:hypothetical protein HZH66_004438 [Vespula vulgaris]|uniref:Uncharacterized protein n=1 Tax=Vespula vulgaris TaxID=7454 RepID=A0A834KFA2_VESVU|nr:hypothetical protein HZH66_004438 [Vespula vulgaris]